MKKVRIGNDFSFAWAITRDGSPEDFTGATEKKLLLKSVGTVTELTGYTITGNIITIEFTPTILTKVGFYVLEFSYTLPDLGFEDEDRKVKVDVYAFEIVPRTAQASGIDELEVSSELAIGFKGDTGATGATGADGANGQDGKEVELQKTATHIQWRLEGGTWADLVALTDLKGMDGVNGANGTNGTNGKEVELQKTATHIQWRLTGGSWTDLVALSDLKGDKGDTGATGAQGIQGVKGDKGDKGDAGANGTTIAFGANKQIPFTNTTADGFSYSSNLIFDDSLKVSGANQSEVKRTGSGTNSTLNILNLLAKTSSDMIDGFGAGMDFSIEDSANVSNLIGRIAAIRSGGADNSGRIAISTGRGGSLMERMTILENGFTGIGTDNPTKTLDVAGNIRALGGVVQSQGTIGGTLYMFTLNGIEGSGPRLQLGTSTVPGEYFEIGAWASINNFNSKNRDLKLYTTNGYIYLTNSTGNVGIGTTAPNEKLDVDGVVKSKFKTLSADPTTTDIPTGYTMLVKNTTSGVLKLWANDGGTLKSVTLT